VELEEVAQIVEACQEEMAGGRSAVGAGAMVGALLGHALEGPNDPALTTNEKQSKQSASSSMPPSMSPSEASAQPTQYPTLAPKRQFPIMIGFHQEYDYFFTLQGNTFVGGDSMWCCGLSLPNPGFNFGIVVLVSTWPPLEGTHDFASMFGSDAGLIGSVGFMAGGFVGVGGYDDDDNYSNYGGRACIGPFLFEFTIGAGFGFPGVEQVYCGFEWKN
jgi:hypothetical protein